jgi:hypothetical protein
VGRGGKALSVQLDEVKERKMTYGCKAS